MKMDGHPGWPHSLLSGMEAEADFPQDVEQHRRLLQQGEAAASEQDVPDPDAIRLIFEAECDEPLRLCEARAAAKVALALRPWGS